MMKKRVVAVIDNAERCPHFHYAQLGIADKILKSLGVSNSPKCYCPGIIKPGYIRKCNCKYDKQTNKYVILDGCPLETVIDEDVKQAVLRQLKENQEAAAEAAADADAVMDEEEPKQKPKRGKK